MTSTTNIAHIYLSIFLIFLLNQMNGKVCIIRRYLFHDIKKTCHMSRLSWHPYFRTGFQKRFSPSATIRGILARYLQLRDWDPVHDRYPSNNKDLGGLIAIEYGDHAHLLTI